MERLGRVKHRAAERPVADRPGVDRSGVDDALRIALAAGLPFCGLRGRAIDYRLFSYVPLEVAQRELVVPLSLEGETLTVAAATAEPDLSEIEATFPGLPLRVVIAPRPEIGGILAEVRRRAA
jgi:hypothetical protein